MPDEVPTIVLAPAERIHHVQVGGRDFVNLSLPAGLRAQIVAFLLGPGQPRIGENHHRQPL